MHCRLAAKWLTSGAICAALLVAGCERNPASPSSTSDSGTSAPPAKLPDKLFVETAPSDAAELSVAKQAAKAGDTVIVHGRIGGGKDPFVENRAMFTLADMKMQTCTERHGDGCKTPWDYCCEPSEVIVTNTATVQVVGADGRPLKAGLRGAGGLNPMTEVIVTGKVSQKPDDKILVIDAAAIYVKK